MGTVLNWFQSYTNGRTQYVQIEDKMSSLLPISTGVPQGSILGPCLLIIYKTPYAYQWSLLHHAIRWLHAIH